MEDATRCCSHVYHITCMCCLLSMIVEASRWLERQSTVKSHARCLRALLASLGAWLVTHTHFEPFASVALTGLAELKHGLSQVVQPVWFPTMFWPGPFGWVQIFHHALFGYIVSQNDFQDVWLNAKAMVCLPFCQSGEHTDKF